MKLKFQAIACILALCTITHAAVVTQSANINTYLTGGGASATSPRSQNFTFTDGSGNSVVLNLTATTTSGASFTSQDGGLHVGVDSSPTTLAAYWDNTEDITFTVGYVSSSPGVDTSTIAFRFDSIGVRTWGGSSATPGISWSVGSDPADSIHPPATEGDTYDMSLSTLNPDYTTIGTASSGAYSAVLHNLATPGGFSGLSLGQLSTETPTSGMQFSASFSTVPEPSAALLGGVSLVGLLRRRRA